MKEEHAQTSPIVKSIQSLPVDSIITVFHPGGQLTGTDDTYGTEAALGLFAMLCKTTTPGTHMAGRTIRAVLVASSITGFYVPF